MESTDEISNKEMKQDSTEEMKQMEFDIDDTEMQMRPEPESAPMETALELSNKEKTLENFATLAVATNFGSGVQKL